MTSGIHRYSFCYDEDLKEYKKFHENHMKESISSYNVMDYEDTYSIIIKYESNDTALITYKKYDQQLIDDAISISGDVELQGIYFKENILNRILSQKKGGKVTCKGCIFGDNQSMILDTDSASIGFDSCIFINGIRVNGNRTSYKTELNNYFMHIKNILVLEDHICFHDISFNRSSISFEAIHAKGECSFTNIGFSNMQWLTIDKIYANMLLIRDCSFNVRMLKLEYLNNSGKLVIDQNIVEGSGIEITFGMLSEIMFNGNVINTALNIFGDELQECVIRNCIVNGSVSFYVSKIKRLFFYKNVIGGILKINWSQIFNDSSIALYFKHLYCCKRNELTISNDLDMNRSIYEAYEEAYLYHKKLNNIKYQDSALWRALLYHSKAGKLFSKNCIKKIWYFILFLSKGLTRYAWFVFILCIIFVLMFALFGYKEAFMSPGKSLYAFGKSVYFSLVTFATLGFGDISPIKEFSNTFSMIAAIEGFLGVIMNAWFVVAFTRRWFD